MNVFMMNYVKNQTLGHLSSFSIRTGGDDKKHNLNHCSVDSLVDISCDVPSSLFSPNIIIITLNTHHLILPGSLSFLDCRETIFVGN